MKVNLLKFLSIAQSLITLIIDVFPIYSILKISFHSGQSIGLCARIPMTRGLTLSK